MTRVHALVPAHNEQERLPAAIRSLLCQTVPPSRITVVSDRSTDGTVEIAKSFGGIVDVMETEGNRHRKSGALNQALARLDIPEDTAVFVMDADSQVVPSWMETALPVLAQPDVGAVGGIFLADGTVPGLVSELESLEYHRYAREVARDGATARVLTGTSTLVMRSTLTEVAQARADGRLPGAGTYHVDALTEEECAVICHVEGCGRKAAAKGLCGKHYQRWKRHGDPNVETRIVGDDRRRMYSKIDKRGPDDCWNWTGSVDGSGYPTIKWKGKSARAITTLWRMDRGPIPEGLELDHTCRNRRCMNLDHVEPVTHKVNMERVSATITHCKHGHEFTPENTAYHPRGGRQCRQCARDDQDRNRDRYNANRREKYRKGGDTQSFGETYHNGALTEDF